MTQRSVELVIGKLVSDEGLRASFRRDRRGTIAALREQGLELNAVESAALEALDPAEFERLSRLLDPRLQKASLRAQRKPGRRAGTFLLVLGLASAASEAIAADTLSLDSAIETALAADREIQDAEMQLRGDDDSIAEARTKRLPKMSVEALGGRTLTPISITIPAGSLGSFPSTGPIPDRDARLEGGTDPSAFVTASIAQPLTQLRDAALGVRLGRTNRAIDEQTLRARRATVVNDVRRLYYGILQTKSLLDAANQRVELLREMDRVVAEQLAHETVLPPAAMEVRAARAAQDATVRSLGNTLATLTEQLNDRLGREITTEFEVAPLADRSPGDGSLEEARRRALANRPEIRQARLRVDQAETQRRLRRAESIPQVSLALTYASFFGVDLLPRNVTQAGIQLKWEPFDWGRRARRTAQAAVAIDQAANAVKAAESRVLLDVGRSFRALDEARSSLEARRLSREAAAEKVRIAMNRKDEQAILLKDALDARTALADAEAQFQKAVLDYWTARAEFERAVGEDS